MISEQELRQLYCDEHLTHEEIAVLKRCSATTIRRRLDELGIESRTRGPEPGNRTDFRLKNPGWTAALAYAVGLIATDGNLSSDGRHLCLRSKDYDLLESVKQCLGIENRITTNQRLLSKYYSLQWSDRSFYTWLETIGLMPAKSLVLGKLSVPDAFFPDFLRGVIDGDGCIRVYKDRWNTFKNPEYIYDRVYVTIASASYPFLEWIQIVTIRLCGLKGAIIAHKRMPGHSQLWELKFAKKESLVLFRWIYYAPDVPALARKRELAELALDLAKS
jgi:hypothetical protein